MKSMEKYISEVYEKYEETEKANKKYKTVKMKRSNPLVSLCGVAACLIVVGTVFYGMKNYQKPFEDDKPNEYVSSENKENGKKVYTRILKIDTKFNSEYLQGLIQNSTDIVLISNFEDKEVTYSLKNTDIILKTIGDFKVSKKLKGNNLNEKEIFSYSRFGGTIALNELEDDENIDWKKWEEDFIGEEISEEEKKYVYYKQQTSKGIEFEKGRQYLLFLKYDEQTGYYDIWDYAYGIMEYDPNTNMVKNIDTGEFEEFDWDLIQENK